MVHFPNSPIFKGKVFVMVLFLGKHIFGGGVEMFGRSLEIFGHLQICLGCLWKSWHSNVIISCLCLGKSWKIHYQKDGRILNFHVTFVCPYVCVVGRGGGGWVRGYYQNSLDYGWHTKQLDLSVSCVICSNQNQAQNRLESLIWWCHKEHIWMMKNWYV